MSDIDKDEFKREYLPLVNTNSEGRMNHQVNNKSILSEVDNTASNKDKKYSAVNLKKDQNDQDETFYQKNKKKIWIALGILLFIGVILAIVLPLTLGGGGNDHPPQPDPDNPVEPDPYIYQEFNPFYVDNVNNPPKISTFQANIRLQYNFTAFNNNSQGNGTNATDDHNSIPHSLRGFMKVEEETISEKASKQRVLLKDGQSLNGTTYRPMNPKYVLNSTTNIWAKNVDLSIQMNSNFQARVLLTNADSEPEDTLRRQVNSKLFQRPNLEIEARLQQVGFKYNTTASFAFNFTDIYTDETLISTMYRKLLLTDMYSQIGFVVPSQRCFGLGQRNGRFQLHQGTYTFNSRSREDSLPQEDELGGKSGNHIHPFMLCQTAVKKDFFGMFFVSTGPQVFEVVKFTNSTQMVVNYITLGTVLEFYVLLRGTAQEVIARYHNLVGMPMMPPYYALGVFHGSNSYNNWAKIRAVYDNYNGALTGDKQALEGVFVEDYNNKSHWTFTFNDQNYPNIGAEVDKIHSTNQRVIFGASYALAPDTNYPWYVLASSQSPQCLIKSHPQVGKGALNGILDNTVVQYLDTYSNCFDSFLTTILPSFNANYAHGLDGLLVKDAHTPNSINGQLIPPASHQDETTRGRNLLGDTPAPATIVNEEMVGFYQPYQINNDSSAGLPLSTYEMPFIPAFKYSGYLDNMTISLNATLGDDLGGGRYSTLYVRNGLAGYALKRTFNAVQNSVTKNASRPLLFSESSWSGSGSYSAALLTNQYRSWDDMYYVISQVLSLSMYGMSATMVDTCGSLGPMDEDLCTRWTQLATFMPMVRNYYNLTYRDPNTSNRMTTQGSEPWTAKTDQAQLAYATLGDRLKLSRYIYTQMYLTHTNGGSLVKPLFFDFPMDDGSFSEDVQQTTFMLGDSVKVSPLLGNKKDGETFTSYFPQGVWVNLYQPSQIINAFQGINFTLNVDSTQTNIHQKSGTIIPYLNNNKNLKTTRDVEQQLRTGFKIVRDPASLYAEGHLMIDDGISMNLFSPQYMDIYQHDVYDKNFTHYNIRISSNKTINFMVQNGDSNYTVPQGMSYQYLDQIDIMNAQDIKNSDFACALNRSWIPINMTVYYTESTQTLTIKPVGTTITFDQLMLIKFGNSAQDVSYCNGFSYKAVFVDEALAETYVRYNLTSTQAPGVVENLIAEFQLLDDDGTVMVNITTESDYESNLQKFFRPPQPDYYDLSKFNKKITKTLADFVQVDTNNFDYKINNNKGQIIYQSDTQRLFISQLFVMDSGTFATNSATGRPIMGIGERAGRAMLKNQKDTVHTIWPYDAPNTIDDGKAPGKNLYGFQPVYYYQTQSSDWVAVFDIGTHAADYFVNSDIDGQGTAKITKITVGGLIQKIFIQGPGSIESVIKKYQALTGYQSVPPMWAFGWNQCKFGYYNESIWWDVYNNYTKFEIPLDTMWADIDYMDDYKVFTISPQTYPTLPDKVKQIKQDGRYFVPIIDNAIAVRKNQSYTPYDSGIEQGVFIMKADVSGPATGAVWPGQANYPDFFKKETVTWWQNNLQDFNNKIQFDGIWLDMNEPSSTCTGYCDQSDRPFNSVKYSIPYLPGQRDLEIQALGLDTVHTGLPTSSGGYRTEMDVRSMYALKESQATNQFLNQNGAKRPFILSRSNSPGLQKYAFHWLADNWSKVKWMQTSIDSIYEYNLFGIPMIGSDICGFNLDATPQLCTRWHQLGSFYPFARNHKNSVWKQTEPFQFNFTVPDVTNGKTYTDLIRTALLQRYSLLRYTYSAFHQIGEVGGSYFKPLYYDFQDDVTTFDDDSTERNILLGNSLKLSIQVQDLDQVSTQYQFPASRWCQLFPTIDKSQCWDTTPSGGASTIQRLDSGIEDYQVHIRGGRIIPFQEANSLGVMKSQDLMQSPTDLVVLANLQNSPIDIAPNQYTAQAAGFIYLDDGTSATDISRVDFNLVSNGDGTFKFNFVTVKDLKNRAAAGQASTVSAINFLWASSTGLDKIKVAKILEVSGAEITLNTPIYLGEFDLLRMNLASSQEGKSWTFWDIKQITLSLT